MHNAYWILIWPFLTRVFEIVTLNRSGSILRVVRLNAICLVGVTASQVDSVLISSFENALKNE